MVTNKFEWKLNDIQFTWKHNSVQCPPAVVATAINVFHRQHENAIFVWYFGMHALLWARIRLSLWNHTCVQIHHKYRFIEPNGICMCFETAPILNRRFAYANRIRLLLFCTASMRLSSVFRVIASKYLLSWCLNGHLYFLYEWYILHCVAPNSCHGNLLLSSLSLNVRLFGEQHNSK